MTNVHDERVIHDSRFWIDTNPSNKPFGHSTAAVVDEEAGGVVAYFCELRLAVHFARHASEAYSYAQ